MIVPQRDDVSPSTMADYEDVLNLWERGTGDPEISDVNRDTVVAFRNWLSSSPFKRGKKLVKGSKRSPSTVNRIMRELHVIMSPCWPADRQDPSGLGLCPFFKWPRSLARQRKLPFVFTGSNLDQLYLHADAYPRRIGCRATPINEARLWRTALVLGLNCGARTWDLLNLLWDDIRLDDPSPYLHGSVVFGARKTNKLHRIPLNECAAQHLRDLKRRPIVSKEPHRVFPGFYKRKTFYKAWTAICEAAGVTGTFECMRKTCVTQHNSIVWQSGYWLSGHVEPGVFGYYDNPSDRIFDSVYRLQNPPEFIKGMNSLIVG